MRLTRDPTRLRNPKSSTYERPNIPSIPRGKHKPLDEPCLSFAIYARFTRAPSATPSIPEHWRERERFPEKGAPRKTLASLKETNYVCMCVYNDRKREKEIQDLAIRFTLGRIPFYRTNAGYLKV